MPNPTLALAVLALALAPRTAFAAELAGGGTGPSWPPVLCGALIGVLSWLAFLLSDRAIGVSSAYARVTGMLGNLVARRHVSSLPYFVKTRPVIEWEVMLLAGLLIGAFLAAWTGRDMTLELLPPLWTARFGEASGVLRIATALGGGALMGFGARMAGGCTSGHGISGTLQLSLGSWLAVACFFLGGMAVAIPLFLLGG